MNMRVNRPDGGFSVQTTSAQPTNPLGSLLKTLADTVRRVLQALAPVLSRVNYSASMTNAAGRNPKVIWAGNLKPGQANTPQGQALIAKQERVLILLAQLLANSLANSDPAKAKENQVLTAQINAIILNDEATVADQEAHDRGVEVTAAEEKYGPGSAEKPQLVPSGGGDWIQSNGQWVHPEVARARAAHSSAEARAVEARAKSDEATAQVDVYAADPEYRSAVAGANRTLGKTLAPEGLTITIKPTKPLAQAQTDLKSAQEVAGKATQSRQKREQAESVLLDALEDKSKVRGPRGPNPAAVGPANSSVSSNVSERSADYEDKDVRAGFAEYGQLSAEADLLDAEIGELVAQQLVNATAPGTPQRAAADQTLETAGNQRKVAQANSDVAVKASDLADAERDLAGVQLQAAPIDDAALNNLRTKQPYLFRQEGFDDGNGDASGSLLSYEVDDSKGDGQLYATFRYENKELVIQLTFTPGTQNVRRSGHERDIDKAWNNVSGCGPNGLLSAQERKQAAEKAYTSSTITQIDVNIALTGKAIPALETALDTALGDHGPAVPVGGPGEAAPFAGWVKSTVDGVEVWVHPEVALILSALNTTRDLDKNLQIQRQHAVAWHDFAVFTATQPTKLLNEDSSQYQSYLQAAYYRDRQVQATQQIELTFGAMAQQALPDRKALFGAEHVLGGQALKSTLQLAGAGQEEAGRMAGKIEEIGGAQATVTFVPFQYIDASVGSQQMLFAIVRGSDGKDHVVDGRGSDYVLEGRKPENIKSFIETYQNDNDLADSGTIVVPKNLSFTAKNDKVETEAHQAHVKTFVEKYVDPVMTGVAAGASLLMLVPVVNVVAAPVAFAAGTYVGGRQVQAFAEDIYYGREITPGRLIMETFSAAATVFPATASASRAIGLRNAGMTSIASLRTSIGATYSRTPYYRDAGAIMQNASGGAIGFARTMDLASIAAGSPLLVVSAYNMMAHGDDPGANPLLELMSLVSGVYGTASGLHAHVEQGRAAPQPITQRSRHVANATVFTHNAPGTTALPGSLGGMGKARGGAPQNVTTAAQRAAGAGGSPKNAGTTGHSAVPATNRVDPMVGGDGAPGPKATPAVLPSTVDAATTASQIVNSGSTTNGDTGNGAADQQARPGRTVEDGTAPDLHTETTSVDPDTVSTAASALPSVADAVAASQMANTGSATHGDKDGGSQEQQARPGRPAEDGTIRDLRAGDAGDRTFMPLWQQARQSPDLLALPADRRAEMEAAARGESLPPSHRRADDDAFMPLWQQARQSPDLLALPADRRAEMEAAARGEQLPPSHRRADDDAFMPLWQQARQSPDLLALPADRRAEMEAAARGESLPPSHRRADDDAFMPLWQQARQSPDLLALPPDRRAEMEAAARGEQLPPSHRRADDDAFMPLWQQARQSPDLLALPADRRAEMEAAARGESLPPSHRRADDDAFMPLWQQARQSPDLLALPPDRRAEMEAAARGEQLPPSHRRADDDAFMPLWQQARQSPDLLALPAERRAEMEAAARGESLPPSHRRADDDAFMPLWQQARQSPDLLALPAERRAEMEAAAGEDVPPSGWKDTKPWDWQENAPDIRGSLLARVRINPGPVGDLVRAMLGAQPGSTPVGSPTWRSYMAGFGLRSNFKAIGAAVREGDGALRDALQSEAGLSVRPYEHLNPNSGQAGLPSSHQAAFQFKGVDLIAAGEQLIYGDTATPSVFDLLPKAGRVVRGPKKAKTKPQGHVVEIVYGLSLRSESATLKPGETDVFGASASNAAGFVRFADGVPYKKVMLEDKFYLHPAWVNELPTSVSKLIPRIVFERRYEVAMDAMFHPDFTVSQEFLERNQTVLGRLRLRTQVVVNNADDAAALAAAPSIEKLQELIAKGAIDQDKRLTYVRGSGSGMRQSAVPGLPFKETIVDLAGNKRRVWSPGSSRLEVVINDKFASRGLINPDRLVLAKAPAAFNHYVPSDGPIFWGLFGDPQNVALTIDRTLAWSIPALPFGVPGVRWLQLPLSASIEGRLFYRTKLPDTAPAVAAERQTSWEFPQADGLVLAVEGPLWLKRISVKAETRGIAVLPRGGNKALGAWLDRLEIGATPSQREAIADFRRDMLPGLKDESFLTHAQASAVYDFIVGQARPKVGKAQDGVVELRPGALELPLKAWYETQGFTVEISRRDPMPLWDGARQDLGSHVMGGGADGADARSSRAGSMRRASPDALMLNLWPTSSSPSQVLDAASGPGNLSHLTDGTGAAPEDIIARIRARLEEEANRPKPPDLSASAQPPGGPTQQLIAEGRGLVGQSPDKMIDGALRAALDYLGNAPGNTPGYRQAIADLGHLVGHIENPGQGAFHSRLQGAVSRANSFVVNRTLDPAAEWLTVPRPAAPQTAAAQHSAGVAPSGPAMPVRTAGSDALLSPDVVSTIEEHHVSLMPHLSAKLRADKAFKPTPEDDRAMALFPLASTDPGVETKFAVTTQLPADVYGQPGGIPAAGLRTTDIQFFDNHQDAAAAVALLPPPKGKLRGGFVYKIEADAKDMAGIGTLAEIPADWLPAAQFIYRTGDVFPAIALRPGAGTAASQTAVVAATPVAAPPQPHVGQGAIANKASTDPIAEARQSPDITVRPDYAGDESGLRKAFVDPANTYWRKKNANQKLPQPDDKMKAQTAYLAIAQSQDDHALKGRPFRKKVTDYATGQVPHLFGSHDYTAIRYIEGPVPPQQIMGGGSGHPPINLSDFTLHSTFEGAREAVQQRPAPAKKKGRRQTAPGGYVYRLVGPKNVLTEAIASGVIDPKLVEGGLRVFDDGSVYPYSVVNRDATYAPKPGETFVKADRPLERKDKRRIVLTTVSYVGGAAFGVYMTARLGTGSHIGARDLLSSLAIYAWLFRGGIAGIRQGAKIRLQKRQDNAALVSDVAHDKFKPGEALLDQLNRQVTGGHGRRLGISKPDRERYAGAIETVQKHLKTQKALPDDKKTPPDPAAMAVVREAVVDMATQPLLGTRGFFHRVGDTSEIKNAAAELHQDPTQSAPWLTIADAHLDILQRRTTGWRGAVWGHSRADRMNYLLAFETLRANRLDAEAMKVLEAAPGRLISPNTPTGRILEFVRYASFGISNANTTRLVTNPFADPAAYGYLGVLDTFGGAADLASNAASAAFLFGNLPGVVGTASKRGVGDADFNAPKKAAEKLDAASGSNAPATSGQAQSATPAQSGAAQASPAGKKQKPHPTYPATSGGGKIIGPVRRFLAGAGDPKAANHEGQLPDGPPEAGGTQKYKPMYKPSLIQRWPQYASYGDTAGMVPFFAADGVHFANALAEGRWGVAGVEAVKLVADWYVLRGAQKDYIEEYRSNRGMGPIVWHSRVTDMFNAPLNGAERNPSSIDKPWLRYGLPPLVLLGAAVAVRIGMSLVFPWEPIEEPPQPDPVDTTPPDPVTPPTPGPILPIPGNGGHHLPYISLQLGDEQPPADPGAVPATSTMRFVTTQEKAGSTLAA